MTRLNGDWVCDISHMVATVPSRRRIDPYIHLPRFCNLCGARVRRIVAAVERLHAFPESGRVVPERNVPEIREVHCRSLQSCLSTS